MKIDKKKFIYAFAETIISSCVLFGAGYVVLKLLSLIEAMV